MGVRVYISGIEGIDDPMIHPEWKDRLEPGRYVRLMNYQKEEDRKRGAVAGWLLKYAMAKEGYDIKKQLFVKFLDGKPYLDGPYFNLSHSGDYVICAVSDDEVGCDIEKIRQGSQGLIHKYFAKEEKERLFALTNQKRKAQYFTALWTLREAYAKKTGQGLARTLPGLFFILGESEDSVRGFIEERELSEMFWCHRMEEYMISVCAKEPVDKIEYPDIVQMDWS